MKVYIFEGQADRMRRYSHQLKRLERIMRQHCKKHDAGETSEWLQKWSDDWSRIRKMEADVSRRCGWIVESLSTVVESQRRAA